MAATPIVEMHTARWDPALSPAEQAAATEKLESGAVLYFPRLPFVLEPGERRYLSAAWCAEGSKNVSLDPATGAVRGARGGVEDLEGLRAMIARFAQNARGLADALFPRYRGAFTLARTSFRPVEVETRESSWRKDDRRLHVDAFPSRPNHGERILRVFTNVNPTEPRQWIVGEPFERLAEQFVPKMARPLPGSAALLAALGLTKGKRSEYDHIMLQLHDRMKADAAYQAASPQEKFAFPPGSTWVVFSDQVSHAVLHGQYLLEQTLHLPVGRMQDPARAPLRVLERLTGRPLASGTPANP
ncbi:MAG TPA: Kdo hydroxylase family protein [Burkholderiales bacterium]|jgi:hypothetical protein|nr:Kdo hydroxylase family protein [Burkholderiales bacterium]